MGRGTRFFVAEGRWPPNELVVRRRFHCTGNWVHSKFDMLPCFKPVAKKIVTTWNVLISLTTVVALLKPWFCLWLHRMVKEFMTVNNTAQIRRLLKVLGQDFALSQNPNSRKGGLIGLAGIAIALGRVCILILLCYIHTERWSNFSQKCTELIYITIRNITIANINAQCEQAKT